MSNGDLEPQTEYVDAIQPKMQAWKRAGIGAVVVAVVIIMALTANLWVSVLVSILVFCALGVMVVAFIGLVGQGPTLADYQAIEEARKQYGLYQSPVVDGSTVQKQAMIEAFEKIVGIQAVQGQELKQEIAGVKTGIGEKLTHHKIYHS